MDQNKNINNVPAPGQVDPSMLRLPVSTFGSALFPRVAPFSAPPFVRHLAFPVPPVPPLYYPCCTATGLPQLYLPPPMIPARFVYSGLRFGPNFRPICSTNALRMEQPEREREPHPKRRKSSEERPTGARSNVETADEKTCNYNNRDDRSQSLEHFSEEKVFDRTKNSENSQRTLSKQDWGQGSQSGGGKVEQKKNEEKMEEEGSNLRTSFGADGQKTPATTNDRPAQASDVQNKPLHRLWEPAPVCRSDTPPPPGVSVSFDFTVMSYNILSQDLLLDNAYLYKHCSPGVLSWDFRLPNLLREIQQHNADILCLQEVQEDHFVRQIRPALEALDYKCVYKKRTGHKSDGCAVCYRRSRLTLLSSNPVEFYRRGDALLDRDNVGLVVRLCATSDPASCFCVANTHLLYNPRRGDIKLAQLAILLAEVSRMSRLPDGSTNPVVLCGDLNSTPSSPLYRFLITGKLDYRGLALGLVSGQEQNPGGQRRLRSPLWSDSLGISSSCQYQEKNQEERVPNCTTQEKSEEAASNVPTAVEGAISDLTVEELTSQTTEDILKRWRIEHNLKLQSSYNHKLSPDGRDEITTCHSRTAMTVDYILYTPDSPAGPAPPSSSLPGERSLQLLGRLSLVGRSELEQVNGLPNQHHSSDHLPLLARFRLQL